MDKKKVTSTERKRKEGPEFNYQRRYDFTTVARHGMRQKGGKNKAASVPVNKLTSSIGHVTWNMTVLEHYSSVTLINTGNFTGKEFQ